MANKVKTNESKAQSYAQRIMASRLRVLCDHGFYGLLLMHMRFGVSKTAPTAYTNAKSIVFGEKFLDEISDKELDFVMMHEVLHVVLQHCFRGKDYDPELFNVACDIVVNSNILYENGMDLSSITLLNYGESMHLAPDGKEGYNYTAEEVYNMLEQNSNITLSGGGSGPNGGGANGNSSPSNDGSWDDHTHWEDESDEDSNEMLEELWVKRFEDAVESVKIKENATHRGMTPLFAQRLLEQLKPSQADWRTLLAEFVSEEVVDYSLFPPDRRYDESPFYLPDFNDTEIVVKDVLFMVDTSGSMSDETITDCYGEVKGAIDQFDGKLRGWLGFFDACIIEPKPFDSVESLKDIRPAGGGGTDFGIIFKFVKEYMQDNLPSSIIILTDGYAPFPRESDAMDIPTLWVITNEEITPPWGKTVRIKTKYPI
ncbi:MAG: hypothetical protein IKC64_05740 [Clostridia bacterium]|nr:hypothetical protein [Clostridia bacterium]